MTPLRLWHARQHWEGLAREDALWAVLTVDGKRGNRWDPQEFFQTGEGDVAADLQAIRDRWPGAATGRALDFGCGVGRLTQPLARRFEEVTGVDISREMLARAASLSPASARISWVLNTRPDLAAFRDECFDFVYSLISLQHIPPPYALGYIREFVRVLAPGGVALFQVPAARLTPLPSGGDWRRRLRRKGGELQHLLVWRKRMKMYVLPRETVLDALAQQGVGEAHAVASDSAGPAFESYRYFVRKSLG